MSLSDIMCVQCTSEPGSPRLSLYTPEGAYEVVQLQFSTDTEMEEWQNHFATVCGQLQQAQGNILNKKYKYSKTYSLFRKTKHQHSLGNNHSR